MISLAACLLALLLIALGMDALPASGITWDWLAGIGLAGLAFLISSSWEAQAPATGLRLTVHRNLAIAATGLVVLHAVGYLITDPIAIEYLKPTAPVYMLMGILAGLLLIALTITALPGQRRRFYRRLSSFRRWHIGLSIATLGTALWHILGSNYLITRWWQVTAMVGMTVFLPLLAYQLRRGGLTTTTGSEPASVGFVNRTAFLAALLSLLIACLYAVVKNS